MYWVIYSALQYFLFRTTHFISQLFCFILFLSVQSITFTLHARIQEPDLKAVVPFEGRSATNQITMRESRLRELHARLSAGANFRALLAHYEPACLKYEVGSSVSTKKEIFQMARVSKITVRLISDKRQFGQKLNFELKRWTEFAFFPGRSQIRETSVGATAYLSLRVYRV